MSELLIRGGRVVDPSQKMDRVCDVLIRDGKIAGFGEGFSAKETIDAEGLCVFPGLVDMHVHLRDPGLTHKEDIFTGCAAAAAGGVTSVACMPNTRPVTDSPAVVREILRKAESASARVYPVAAITKGLSGDSLSDFRALREAGAVAFSDDGRPVENAALMQAALIEADRIGIPVISHCEDLAIINGGIINEGAVSQTLGVRGMHRSSEDSVTAREIALAEATGTAVHIAHVSTKGSVAVIRDAKARGVRVTAETAPHYYMLTDALLLLRDADYRMNPPLREKADRDAVLQGVLDGTIDCIVTDHAPHTPEEKADFKTAPNGVIGLETSFAASMTSLVHTGKLELGELIRKMSYTPARILGIRAGTLKEGSPADIAIADLNEEWTVDPDALHSKSRNTVFKGMTFKGRIRYTLLGGKIVFTSENGKAE